MRRADLALGIIALAIGAMPWHQALANPTGPTPVRGVSSISGLGTSSVTVNTNNAKAIINWQGFSIGVDELTRFNQPSATAAVLNRVTSTQASEIFGTLQSNGRLFLINPNGILFGRGASVDVAGLVASSLNMSDGDFLAGRMRFTATAGAGSVATSSECRAGRECGPPGSPSSAATITTHGTGGQVYLIGSSVRPEGNITSGEIVVAAGNSVEVINPGTPGVTVKITAGPGNTIELFRGHMSGERINMFAGLIHIAGDPVVSASTAIAGANGTVTLRSTGDINIGPEITFPGFTAPHIEASKRVKMIADGNIAMSSPPTPFPAVVQGGDIVLKGDNITQGANASLLGRNLTIAASGDVDLGNVSNSVARFGGRASGDVVFNNTSPTLKVTGLTVTPPHSLSLAQDGDLKIRGNVISGPQTISATGNVLVTPGRTGGIIVFAAGPQSIESGGDMTIRGTRDRFALIVSSDSSDLTVGGTLRLKRALIAEF
jgi:filamentous hemagglutinin family protein